MTKMHSDPPDPAMNRGAKMRFFVRKLKPCCDLIAKGAESAKEKGGSQATLSEKYS